MIASVPEASSFSRGDGLLQQLLSHWLLESCSRGTYGGNDARPIRQNQEIASTEPLDIVRSILNGRLVARGHQGTHVRQISDERGRARQGEVSLLLEALVSIDGIA